MFAETARIFAGALAVMFAVAAASKVTQPRGGWARIVEHVAGRRVAFATSVLIPAAEASAVVTLVEWPQLGLRAAAALLAIFALGVARAVRSGLTGVRCSCLGGVTSSQIGLPLAIADVLLAAGALGGSFVRDAGTGSLPAGQLLAGAAAFSLALLVIRIPPPSRLGTGRRLRGLWATHGQAMAVVLVSPGCPPCERLAPELASYVAAHADVELVVVIGPGAAAERERLAGVIGTSARLDLERLLRHWQIPGTPWGIAVAADGRVSAHGPARQSAHSPIYALRGRTLRRRARRGARRATRAWIGELCCARWAPRR